MNLNEIMASQQIGFPVLSALIFIPFFTLALILHIFTMSYLYVLTT